MKLARSVQIKAIDAALLGAVLGGELDQPALDALATCQVVPRTTFGVEDGQPFQHIGPADVGTPETRRADGGSGCGGNARGADAYAVFDLQAQRNPVVITVGYERHGHGYYELNTRATSRRHALAHLKQLPQLEAQGPHSAVMDFIEGTRVVAEGELQVKGRNSTRCCPMERVR